MNMPVLNESKPKKIRVFIDVLLDMYENEDIDIKENCDEVDTFVFAGHDTTSSALGWMLHEIGRYPNVQRKLHNAINQVTAKQLPLVEEICSLKYLECVIKESLRLNIPATGVSRLLENDVEVKGMVLPAGSVISMDIVNLHRNPAY